MMQPVRVAAALLLASTLATTARSTAQSTAQSTAATYQTNPKFVQAIQEGKQLLRQHRASFAKDAFSKANKIAGGSCAECLNGVFQAELADGDFKGAISAAQHLHEIATSPMDKSVAEYKLGTALFLKAGDKPKPEHLEAAHEALQQALTDYPRNAAALFLDGKVLAYMGKIDDAKARFTACLSCASPSDPARLRAEHFAEDPALATKRMAPAFEVTALDGTRFNLDAMGGRVVLIDFWATWCGPCNEELPHMKKIAQEFAGEPLVILSVSWDNDDAKWRAFIEKNGMSWMQYRDADKALTREFGINAIPHYFTIDADGVLTSEMLGEGSNVEGRLKKLLAKARAAQKEQLTAQQSSGAGGS